MDDETGAGASYLASLRQSSISHATGAAPAREASSSAATQTGAPDPASSARPSGADKRKSPRYKCAGSVRLQEVGSGVATWATLADISVHGCYVETASPLHVGAMVGLKLDANGFRVEATGEVRVLYPGLGMGVSFSRMSDDDRDRLRQLVRSVLPASVGLGQRGMGQRVTGNTPSPSGTDALAEVTNPGAALRAIYSFFQHRPMLGREEFLKIVRKSQ